MAEALGFGLAVALGFGFGPGFGLVTAFVVASGRSEEAGGVDAIAGGDHCGDAEGGALVRGCVGAESRAEGCGSGVGKSTAAVFGWYGSGSGGPA